MPLESHSEEGIEVLTPGHFLIGRPLESLPEIPQPETRSAMRCWNLVQQISQQFWDRWTKEYLRHLQRHSKWQTETTNVKVGDIVLIREDGVFTHEWPMARVIQTFPGKDGLVRAVLLNTARTTLRRPITKVARLVTPND